MIIGNLAGFLSLVCAAVFMKQLWLVAGIDQRQADKRKALVNSLTVLPIAMFFAALALSQRDLPVMAGQIWFTFFYFGTLLAMYVIFSLKVYIELKWAVAHFSEGLERNELMIGPVVINTLKFMSCILFMLTAIVGYSWFYDRLWGY